MEYYLITAGRRPHALPVPLLLLRDGTRVPARWWDSGWPLAGRQHQHSRRQGASVAPGTLQKAGGLVTIHPSRALLFLATATGVYDAADLPWDCPRAEIQCGRPGLESQHHSAASRLMGTDHNRTLTGCPYESAILLRSTQFSCS